MTPALCSLLLKGKAQRAQPSLQAFNNWFGSVTNHYSAGVVWMIRRGALALVLFAGMVDRWRPSCGGHTPGSLVPDEDQGFYIAAVILPDGASLQRTDKVVSEVVEAICRTIEQSGRRRVYRSRLSWRRYAQ